MNVSAKIELDTRSQKKDGTFPLKLLLVIDRQPIRIPSGYSLPLSDWNEKTQSVKSSSKIVENTTRLNAKLQWDKTKALEVITQLIDSGEIKQMSPLEIKDRITGKRKNKSYLIEFFDTTITELELTGKVGNARVYKMVRNSISNFLEKMDVPLGRITYKWLKEYEIWYLSKGNTINGLSFNFRTLRTLLNRAIKRKILSRDSYAFELFSIKKEATKKRAIKQEDLDILMNYTPKNEQEVKAKDYFLISFYLMGASFVDLAFLKIEDIRNGRIEYRRKKTGKLHSIKITPSLQNIINKYIKGKALDDFLFDIVKIKTGKSYYQNISFKNGNLEYSILDQDKPNKIKVNEDFLNHLRQYPMGRKRQEFLTNAVINEEVKKQYTNIRNELKKYNNTMKGISSACGIDHNITSYVARHSFATIAKYKGVPISVISQALGHSDIKTTEVYLSQFENDVMDKYNEFITGG